MADPGRQLSGVGCPHPTRYAAPPPALHDVWAWAPIQHLR